MMNAWKKCVFGAIVLSGLSLNVFAQSVSVNLKNVTVKDAIKYVQKESGYSFVYISTDFLTSSMRHPKQKSHLDGSKSDLIARCFSVRKSVFVK